MDKNECVQSIPIDIDAPQRIINVIETMETQERENNVEIDAKYQAVKCYRNIFGTSSSFKLVVDLSSTIYPVAGTTSPTLVVDRTSKPKTFKMCLNDKYQPEFVTFTRRGDNLTVFTPEVKVPIGRVVRKKSGKLLTDESDIICYATNMKFTMKSFKNANYYAPSMKIFDSNGRVLAAANVHKMVTTTRNDVIMLEEFMLQFDDSISEPTKVMVLVAFSNWAMRSSCGADDDRGPCRSILIIKCILTVSSVIAFIVGLINQISH